jgi:signal transduction histidine kinase
LIKERDFTCKFVEVGQTEMDQLIQVYNRMIDALREERTRLTEQHYFLGKVLAASPSGILTLDYDGRIALVNPSAARLLQSGSQALEGRTLAEVGSSLAGTLIDLAPGESRVIPFHGSRRLKCRRSQFLDRGFARAFYLIDELTEELRLSEKRGYEKLIRIMSHEVNNSIAAIRSLLESCSNYAGQLAEDDREDFKTAIQVANSRADHLNLFMRRFADVVRLPPPERRPCDVKQLLEDLASLVAAECQRRDIRWIWDIQEELPPIPMDKNLMEQAFVNILKNSMEAIGEHGAVTIRIGRQADGPYVFVEDSGCGIAEEIRSSLFTPFFSTKAQGQGIGLALVQEILTQHGFGFSLDGPPGGPTRFAICFGRTPPDLQ